jgi:transglutaminase-like putative cysteine protease
MRAFIRYQLQIDFPEPARGLTQVLRLTPRSFDGQHVQDWFVGVDPDARLRRAEDAFGNIAHSCSHDGPLERVAIFAEGLVETTDAAGVVQGLSERFPLDLYLRDAEATHAGAGLREFAKAAVASEKTPLGGMHALMEQLHEKCAFEPGDAPPRPAKDVFASAKGSARELAQVFVAAARAENIPARFVSGFFLGDDAGESGAHHAWAEVYVEPIGWIGFDCALGFCPKGEHLRIAQGLDYYGAAPRRGSSFGFAREQAETRLTLDFARQASWQAQQ